MKTPAPPAEIAVHCAHDRLVDVTELVPNPRNPNKHPDKQVALLAKIIRHQGWRAPIVVSNRSGFIVTGHGRLEAAKLLGVQSVPVNFQEFASEADEWAHVIADNRIAELAETDGNLLTGLLKDLGTVPEFDFNLCGLEDLTRDVPSLKSAVKNLDEPKSSDPSPQAVEAKPEGAKRVVAVMLSVEEHSRWQGVKDNLGITDDTTAFKRIVLC